MRAHALVAVTMLALPLAAPAVSAQPRSEMRFRGMDTNGDGVIARAEWRGSEQSFRVHDWNGDGVLSGDEVRVGAARRRSPQDEDFDDRRAREFTDWTPDAFVSHDHDRDGRIERSEWHYDLESFRRADRNGDSTLTRDEFLSIDTDADREDRFEYLDADRDGRIERTEWHASRDAFEWLDRNNDGVLSRMEVVGEETAAPDLFVDLDTNRDGRISRNEWHWSRLSFDRRDRDSDGQLTRAELGTSATTGGVGTPGAVGTSGRWIDVDASHRWVDTGIDVRAGDRITIQAEGTVALSTNPNDIASPSGAHTGRRAENAPLRSAAAGALIARVGNSAPILIGGSGTINRAPETGRLYLSVNDDHLADNSGQFRAMVTVDRR